MEAVASMAMLKPLNSSLPLLTNNTQYINPSQTLLARKPWRCGIVYNGKFSSHFALSIRNSSFAQESASHVAEEGKEDDDEDDNVDKFEYQVMLAIRSSYNDIVILDTPESKLLLLDSSNNVHSTFKKGKQIWTGAYWDEFASLPAIVPKGSIAILGLGGGTAAHLMRHLWPALQIEGWEIDQILIDKAREYLCLSNLETCTGAGGVLDVRVGDALSPSVTVPGGYSGIVVDLFYGGKVLPELQEVETWLEMKSKLMPNGRILVNCGAADTIGVTHAGTWEQNSTIKAMYKAFPGELSWKKLPKNAGENYLALTGSLPDLSSWAAALPEPLSSTVNHWRTCR